jgi:hypothetical protein
LVSIVVGNDGNNVREVDDHFLRDYPGPSHPLQLTVERGDKTIEQCRSMDYFGPPKVTSIPPGSEFKLQTGISALVHTFCLYDPGTYSLQVSYVAPNQAPVVSNTATFVVTQERIDHHIRPSDSSR